VTPTASHPDGPLGREGVTMDWKQAEIWIRAGGRCAICKKFLLDDRHGEVVPIGEVAHNVGRSRSKRSPRGQDPLPLDQRDKAANLLLLCRNEHRIADTRRLEDQRFTVDYLDRLKVEHEQAIHHLTSLVADRGTLVLRVVGTLGDKQGDISKQQVDTALAARDRYSVEEMVIRFATGIERALAR
jgi:hypothetical protein